MKIGNHDIETKLIPPAVKKHLDSKGLLTGVGGAGFGGLIYAAVLLAQQVEQYKTRMDQLWTMQDAMKLEELRAERNPSCIAIDPIEIYLMKTYPITPGQVRMYPPRQFKPSEKGTP